MNSECKSSIKLAEKLGIELIIYRALKDRGPSGCAIPPDIEAGLKEKYLKGAVRSARLFFEAARILKKFHETHIPVLALKGLSLAEELYGDTALRPMGDIDLLVRKEDLTRAGNLLLSIGYKQQNPHWNEVRFAHRHLPVFINQATRMPVEVHWNVISPDSPFNIDIDGLWKRARAIKVAGEEVLSLSLEDALIYLCLHVAYHHGFRVGLIHFYDISRFLQAHNANIDWAALNERVRKWGAQKHAYITLSLVRKILKADIPDKVMDGLRPDGFDPSFVDYAQRQAFFYGPNNYSPCRRLFGVFRPGGRSILKSMFPPMEYIAYRNTVNTSSHKLYLYYLLRLYRILLNHIRLFLGLIRFDGTAIRSLRGVSEKNALFTWLEAPEKKMPMETIRKNI